MSSFCRGNVGYGGVVILTNIKYKNSVKRFNIEHSAASSFECCAATLKLCDFSIQILGVYRAPDQFNLDAIFQNLDDTLTKISKHKTHKRAPVILTTDLNIELHVSNTTSDHLIDNTASHNLRLVNTESTRVTHHSNTLIDQIVTNIHESYTHFQNIPTGISDHQGVVLSVSNIEPPHRRERKQNKR